MKNLELLNEDERDAIVKVAQIFRCRQLEAFVRADDEDAVKSSSGQQWNDKTARMLNDVFFDKSPLADIVFDVAGLSIYLLPIFCRAVNSRFNLMLFCIQMYWLCMNVALMRVLR